MVLKNKYKFVFERVYIASDHAGFEAKMNVIKILNMFNIKYLDLGPKDSSKSVDYPKFAQIVSKKVLSSKVPACGILLCGSGTGMQIAANKVKGIRAAFSYDEYSAVMSRFDNDANVLTLRARKFDFRKYRKIILGFLCTAFSGEKRHEKRIGMLEK